LEIDVDEKGYEKVQLRLYLDFSDESEEALRISWLVAEELLERNIFVEVEPIHQWFNDLLDEYNEDLPKIFINGKLMFIGRAPSREELIDAIFDRIGKYIKPVSGDEKIVYVDDREGFCEVEIIDF